MERSIYDSEKQPVTHQLYSSVVGTPAVRMPSAECVVAIRDFIRRAGQVTNKVWRHGKYRS